MAGLVALGASVTALAHGPERVPAGRELVRLAGYREALPGGATATRETVLVALAVEHRFLATAWRRFGFGEAASARPEPARLVLQGPREVLARFAAARPAVQRVTILAERRPGSPDLFVLELDLCPAE